MAKKFFLLTLIFISFFTFPAFALDVPNYSGRVNDLAGLLKGDQVALLEKEILQNEKETSNQIAILTITSLEGDSLEDFSIRVVDSWKVGQKSKDNGVLILVVKDDRKTRIEVGRGLEGSLTDLVSGRIIDKIMIPAFQKGEYFRGLSEGIGAIKLAVKGEFTADEEEDRGELISGAYIILAWVAGFAGALHFLLGGAVGGIGTFFLTMFFFNPGLPALVLASVVGFLIGMIACHIIEYLPVGGFSDGGGFGGGGFGGGGASGSW